MAEADTTWYIYVLTDPRDDAVRYVGWTKNPSKRLASHLHQSKRCGTHKRHWIAGLIDLGLRPRIVVIETGADAVGWKAAEVRWIAHYRAIGCQLTNGTDGGDGALGMVASAETRAKMSASGLARDHNPAALEAAWDAIRGKKHSAERRSQNSNLRLGIPATAATEAARLVTTGKKQSPEHVAKRMVAQIGRISTFRKLSPEAVRDIRACRGVVSQRALAVRHGAAIGVIFAVQHRLRYADILD